MSPPAPMAARESPWGCPLPATAVLRAWRAALQAEPRWAAAYPRGPGSAASAAPGTPMICMERSSLMLLCNRLAGRAKRDEDRGTFAGLCLCFLALDGVLCGQKHRQV